MASSMFADTISSSESSSDEGGIPTRTDNRFMHYPSDEEDGKRVVRSARDKRLEEMQTIIKNVNNHKKIRDMSSIFTDFENLTRLYEKSLKMNELDGVPPFYVRCIAELEDFVNDSWEKKKDMNKTAAKSLTVLKQRVKKYLRDFEEQIKDFREHPENYEEEEAATIDSDDDEDDDELNTVVIPSTKSSGITGETGKKTASSATKKTTAKNVDLSDASDEDGVEGDDDADDSDEDSDSLWGDSDESSSSDDMDVMERYKDDPSVYFLKKTTDDKKKDKKVKKVGKERIPKKASKTTAAFSDEEADGTWTIVDVLGRPEPQVQVFERGQEITHELVVTKLNEITSVRGKKGTIAAEQVMMLLQIEEKIKENRLSIGLHTKVLFSLVSVLSDYDAKSNNAMSNASFERLLNAFDRIFDILENHNMDIIAPGLNDTVEPESLENPPFLIYGSILTMTQQLHTECTKVLQNTDNHDTEYIERLKDERRVCGILDRLCAYLEKRNASCDDLCIAYLLKIEHLYYKFDFIWARRVETEGLEAVGPYPTTSVIESLCKYIYSNDRTARLRTRAILCHIYHLALYDNWFKARDLMLMSNLQMSIERADQSTMILYNRAMVQLGLAAFRQGYIRDAHNALADLIGSMRIRELLAQGLYTQTRFERSAEDEKREKDLQMPYHMHINTELLECVYLVSAMLLEIPNLAAHETDLRWRPLSKPFHLALRVHDRQTLVGPPETPRDHVLAAAKAMRYGNWKACLANIFNPKMDSKIWNSFFHSSRVRKLLEGKIKEESLRSFLFTYSAIHNSMSLDRLTVCFDLPKSSIYSIIGKMITNQELAASLEVPSDFLIMHKTERSRLQTLALQLSDKVNSIVEMNEKLIESRGGNAGYQSYQGRRTFALSSATSRH